MRLPKYTVLSDAEIRFTHMWIEDEAMFVNCVLTSSPSPMGPNAPLSGAIEKLVIQNCILDGEALVSWFVAHNLELKWQDGNYLKGAVNAPGPVRIAAVSPNGK